MGAAGYLARAELRRSWKAFVGVAVLIGVVGAVVLTVVAGARRSASAYGRFLERSRSADVTIFYSDSARLDEVASLPEVEVLGRIVSPFFAPLSSQPRGEFTTVVSPDGRYLYEVDGVRVMKGRMPDAGRADELAVTERVASVLKLTVGQQLTFRSFAPEQIEMFGDGPRPEPAGPSIAVNIVGIVRAPHDIADLTAPDLPSAYLTPAFYRAYGDRLAAFDGISRVRLRRGEADLPRFGEAVSRLFADDPEFAIAPGSTEEAKVQDAIQVVVIGLLLFAVAAAAAGSVAVDQVLSRRLQNIQAEAPVLSGLGMTRAEGVATAMLALAPSIVGGAVLAAALGLAASPMMPINIARKAEPDPGISFDPLVLGLGALTLMLVSFALAWVAAWRSTTTSARALAFAGPARSRPSVAARVFAAAGLPPFVTTGAHMAFDAGRGRTAVPARSGMVGAVFGAASVVAVAVFIGSQDHLVRTPSLYGWNWDVSVPGAPPEGSGGSAIDHLGPDLAADATISDVGAARVSHAEIHGVYLHVIGFSSIKGSIAPAALEGRIPREPTEVALGASTLRHLNLVVGDRVEVPGVAGPVSLQVVGRTAIPFLDTDAIADAGAVMTAEGADRLVTTQSHSTLLIRWEPGTDVEIARRSLEERVGTVVSAQPPSDVVNLVRIGAIPRALGLFMGLLAVLAVGHTLVATVRRRNRDFAILKALGFRPRQVWATVATQATLVVAAGLALGLPLGIVLGRWSWSVVVSGIGVGNRPQVPFTTLAAISAGALIVANLVAALPARAAGSTSPAWALRAE